MARCSDSDVVVATPGALPRSSVGLRARIGDVAARHRRIGRGQRESGRAAIEGAQLEHEPGHPRRARHEPGP